MAKTQDEQDDPFSPDQAEADRQSRRSRPSPVGRAAGGFPANPSLRRGQDGLNPDAILALSALLARLLARLRR